MYKTAPIYLSVVLLLSGCSVVKESFIPEQKLSGIRVESSPPVHESRETCTQFVLRPDDPNLPTLRLSGTTTPGRVYWVGPHKYRADCLLDAEFYAIARSWPESGYQGYVNWTREMKGGE